MPDLGLPAEVLLSINDVISSHPAVTGAAVFGSRAKGTAKPYSDVDIVLYGQLDLWAAESIACKLDEIPVPYSFDVTVYDLINNPELKKHIDRVEIKIYSKSNGGIYE